MVTVPAFVLSHRPAPPSVADYPLITYVTDGIESAMAQAKSAAGDRNVHVIGAYTAQRALEAELLDEIQSLPRLSGAAWNILEDSSRTLETADLRSTDND
jgi:hypothetical protein